MLAAHDLSSEKELLDLVFSESGVVGGTGNARANEASHCSENEPPPIEIMRVHRSTLPDGAHKSTPSASRSATQNVRNPRSEEHMSELQSPYDLVCRLLLEKNK